MADNPSTAFSADAIRSRAAEALCTDRSRRINNSEAAWETTLESRPKSAYDFWHEHLRPLGFHLTAAVLDYPGGYDRRHRLHSQLEIGDEP